jgi:hypothetical protein
MLDFKRRNRRNSDYFGQQWDRLVFSAGLSPFVIPAPPSSIIPALVIVPSLFFMKASRVRKAPGYRRTVCQPGSKQWPKFIFRNLAMDLNVKLLRSSEGRNHLIIIAGGLVDADGLERIFRQVAEIIRQLFNCKILIDFENANLRIEPADIDELVNRLGPELRLGNIAIALMSSAEIAESEQLRVLSDSLCREDLRAAVFHNAQEAVLWLIDTN